MGLEDFLIPREPSPRGAITSLGDLEDLVATPPLAPDTEPESAAPMGVAPTPRARLSMPLQARPGDRERVDRSIEPPAALAADIIITSPAAEATSGMSRTVDSTSDLADAPASGQGRPFAPPPELVGRLEAFLARTVEPTDSHPVGIEKVESEFISTAPFVEFDRAIDIPAPPRPVARASGAGEAPPAPGERLFRWSDRGVTAPRFEGVSDGASFGGRPEDGFDQIEERLSQVTDRLERAAERFDSPPPLPGSRPRPFRGRVGG